MHVPVYSLYHFIYSFRVTSLSLKHFCFKMNWSYNMLPVWLLESSDPPKVVIKKTAESTRVTTRGSFLLSPRGISFKTSIVTVQTICLVFKCLPKGPFKERFINYLGLL